jgi:predicted RNA-binding protein with PIN domain
VDGYNLLWVFPPLRKLMIARNSGAARRGLVALLEKIIKAGNARGPIVVVFDGNAMGERGTLSIPGVVEVRFAPHPSDADSMIIDLVRTSTDPGSFTVVTSDREVQSNVRRLGAAVLGAKRFIDTYVPPHKSTRQPVLDDDELRAAEKPRAALGAFEVDMWLKEFGFTDDDS